MSCILESVYNRNFRVRGARTIFVCAQHRITQKQSRNSTCCQIYVVFAASCKATRVGSIFRSQFVPKQTRLAREVAWLTMAPSLVPQNEPALLWLVFLLTSPVWAATQFLGDQDFVPAAVDKAQTLSCTDIHGDSFGDQSLKPGVCYLAANEKGVFLDARTFCQGLNDSLGWDVVDIEDKVEIDLVQGAMATLKANGSLSSDAIVFWIGQNDLKTENVWSYLNDSSNNCNRSVYLNWETNQPNGGRRQNCMAYFYEDGGNFQDRCCDDTYYYLCKVKVTSDTVPTCPGFVEDTSTEAPDECLDIWPVAFSNPSVPGVCYAHESYQAFTFKEALDFCDILPGSWSVVDIEDADENLFLEAWNRDNFPKNNGYWIGQNDREQEDDWRYTSSGQCPVYLNWDSSQPNGVREQNCMVMLKKSNGKFQDKDCSERSYYSMCKFKKDPGPTQDPVTNCNGSTVPPEVAACSSLYSEAFGSVDNPGVCYAMVGKQKTWEEALAFCQGKGWELVDIENALENEILTARYRDYRPFDLNYWVGQNDREMEGTWKYSSNDTPSDGGVYLNWDSSQPNGGSAQNCIMMTKLGTWEDKECSNYYYVTCKRRIAQPTTTPAPWTDRNAYDVSTGDIISDARTTTEAATTLYRTTAGATTPPPIVAGTTQPRPPTTVATTLQQTTEGATTEESIGTTQTPSTTTAMLQQTTEGATSSPFLGTTQTPSTAAAILPQTAESATSSPFLDPITRSGRFVLRSANATCSPKVALPSFHAKDTIQCARKCLLQGNCLSFSFLASGNEDACVLCTEVLAVVNLSVKTGSLYYTFYET